MSNKLDGFNLAHDRPEEVNDIRCLASEIIIKLYEGKHVSQLAILKGAIDRALELLK